MNEMGFDLQRNPAPNLVIYEDGVPILEAPYNQSRRKWENLVPETEKTV